MKHLKPLLGAIALTSIGVAIETTSVQATSMSRQRVVTTTEFNQMVANKDFIEKFVAQSRIGNNANNGTQEIDLLDAANGHAVVAQTQNVWVSGSAVDFSLSYKNSVLTYIVGNKTISSTKFSGRVTDLFFRTRSAADSSMLLSDLKLTDNKVTNFAIDSVRSDGANDVDFLQLSQISGDFTITGKSTMTWRATARPNNSNLAYQIKVGVTRKIPEPGTVGALALVGLAGIVARKRQSATQSTES